VHIRILAADDNEADIFLLRQGLDATGATFLLEHVCDGEQAIRRMTEAGDKEMPDLLLVDLHLPRISGQEVIVAVRARNLTTPIIVLTSMPRERDRASLAAIGAQLVLGKPNDLDGYYTLGSTIKGFYAAGSEK